MARKKFEYRNPDGTLKIMKVIERLSDGTRVFEDGSRAFPSAADSAEEQRLLKEMSEEEYKAWNDSVTRRLGKGMSDFYAAYDTADKKQMI